LGSDPRFRTRGKQEQLKRRYLIRRFWRSGIVFWRGKTARHACLLTGGLLIVILLNLAVQYGINVWNRTFFDALEKRDSVVALTQAMIFPALEQIPIDFTRSLRG
jgi:vitamin B12/bleomycin/antimicrobial peptide transport system ATP-binding/permease protein